MELRKAEFKTIPKPRNDGSKPRFQIVKLEERIAPHRFYCYIERGRRYCTTHCHGRKCW